MMTTTVIVPRIFNARLLVKCSEKEKYRVFVPVTPYCAAHVCKSVSQLVLKLNIDLPLSLKRLASR